MLFVFRVLKNNKYSNNSEKFNLTQRNIYPIIKKYFLAEHNNKKNCSIFLISKQIFLIKNNYVYSYSHSLKVLSHFKNGLK